MALEDLGNAILGSINQAAGIGENVPANPENPYSYQDLGAFAQKIDRTEQRIYLESGWVGANVRPQSLEILMQQPDITVLVKKRHFSSLSENYRYDLMSQEEKTYIRAIKRLFYNKCRAIAAYERLTKIEQIITKTSPFNDYLLPMIFSSVDILNTLSPGLISGNTLSVLDTLKKVKNFSETNNVTTWLNFNDVPYLNDVGDGTGVIELTLVSSLNTKSTVKFGGGSAQLNIENPNELMIIKREDIEQAISDVVGFTNNPFFSIAQGQLNDVTEELKNRLQQVRSLRGAAPIKFLTNQGSVFYKKVRAIIDEEGREIIFTYNGGVLGIDADIQLDQSALEGINGLQGEEIEVFKQIVGNIFIIFGMEQTRRNEIRQFNKENNSVRSRMILEFEEQAIIQQCDEIRIFCNSKSKLDSGVSAGFNFNFTKDNLLNTIDTGIAQVEQAIDDIASSFGFGGSSYAELEKDAIAGPEFPNWLWMMLRNQFTRQSAGTHIWGGVVDNVSQNWSSGRNNLSVNASDNCWYLKKSPLNIKPAIDAVDSSLYDPLTPFKTDFDSATGFLILNGSVPELLDENIALLNSNSVRFNSGRNRGNLLTLDNYFLQDQEILSPENPGAAKIRNVLHDPQGFVRKWKRGIGSLVLSGSSNRFGTGSLRSEVSPVITNNPFAGQDVMNVLSLLITGQPYNFNNFLKAAVNSGFVTRDDLFNQKWSDSFLKGLINDVSKNNTLWGNFVPFKKLTINQAAYNFLRNGSFDATRANQKIKELLQQRSSIFDELIGLFPGLAKNPQFYKVGENNTPITDASALQGITPEQISQIGEGLINLDLEIDLQIDSFNKSLNLPSNLQTDAGSIRIIGDDISFDPTLTNISAASYEDQLRAQEEFRKKILALTQRRLFKVKANEDPNLFIVDDSYDKNYDIQAFEASLASAISSFRSQYTNVAEKVQEAANLLGLEVFADSQGHINARPPGYNKIPSSVFYKMLLDKETKGIQIFPEYLESLFFNQIQGLSDKIEILEDQIRLRGAILGAFSDDDLKQLLAGSQKGVGNGNFGSVYFEFCTAEDGRIKGDGIRKLLLQNNPDFLEDANRQALTELSTTLSNPNNALINFDIAQRVSVINKPLQDFSTAEVSDRIAIVTARLKNRNFNDPILNQIVNITSSKRQADVVNITEQISNLLAERQYLIKLLANAVKNLEQGTEVNATDSADGALLPSLSKNKPFPEILTHMIEDEDIDDLGPGAGSRYILRPVDIISLTINQNVPPFTIIEVNGSLANNLVQSASGLEVGDGGNFQNSAWAVDYDMWRMFGFQAQNSVSVPFLSDPASQCAPFSVFLLSQARRNILNASIDCRGNEYLQPGEVYYIEHRDLLFYAESINHSFDFSGRFSSSIEGTYGRKPGQFIPTMLDIIGKGLYANRNQADLIKNVRNSSANSETHITVLTNYESSSTVIDDVTGLPSSFNTLVTGNFSDQNKKNISNLILATSGLLTPTIYGDQLKIELRIYYNPVAGVDSANAALVDFAEAIKEWVVNPSKFQAALGGESVITDNQANTIDPEAINIVEVDLSAEGEIRSPSTAAWALARNLAGNTGNFATSNETNNLFSYVIDVWASFEDPVGQNPGTDTSENPTDQNSQIQREKYLKNFNSALGIS